MFYVKAFLIISIIFNFGQQVSFALMICIFYYLHYILMVFFSDNFSMSRNNIASFFDTLSDPGIKVHLRKTEYFP